MIRSWGREQGLTIIELLVVMGLIAVLSGIGVGMMRKRDSNLTTEVNGRLLRSILRQARNSAKTSGAGVVVRLDPEENLVEASPISLGGCWHFEDETGSRNMQIQSAVELVDDGWMGRALKLSGGSIDLGNSPFFEATQGFRLRFKLKPDAGSKGVLIKRQNGFKLTLTEEGAIRGEIIAGKQNQTVSLKTRPGLVTADRWQDVSFIYDRLEMAIEIDGVQYAAKAEHRRLFVDPKAHLLVGGDSFKGLLDELRYDVALDGKIEEFTTGVDVVAGADLIVRFDGNGRLDKRFHKKPVTLILQGDAPDEESDPVREEIRIEFTGVIR